MSGREKCRPTQGYSMSSQSNNKGVEKRYDTITIDPDLDSRMRLKQAMSSVYNFGKNFQSQSLDDARSRLGGSEPIDVVFVSSRYSQEDIKNFILKGKETKYGQDCAYVLVLQAKDQHSSSVAQNVMIGTDGFLFEPYSVDQLLEITRLAARVKKERGDARERAAVQLLVQDVINQLDQVAYLRSCSVESANGMKKLKDLCSMFHTLTGEKLDIYYQSAVKAFEEAPIPKAVYQPKKYGGVSSRIKKKLEDKILSELAKSDAAKEKKS
jgi:response regulator RpfG family c-di-GMP phosphodiesterase